MAKVRLACCTATALRTSSASRTGVVLTLRALAAVVAAPLERVADTGCCMLPGDSGNCWARETTRDQVPLDHFMPAHEALDCCLFRLLQALIKGLVQHHIDTDTRALCSCGLRSGIAPTPQLAAPFQPAVIAGMSPAMQHSMCRTAGGPRLWGNSGTPRRVSALPRRPLQQTGVKVRYVVCYAAAPLHFSSS